MLRITTESEYDQQQMYKVFRAAMQIPMDKQPENVELIDSGVRCEIGKPARHAKDDPYGAYTE